MTENEENGEVVDPARPIPNTLINEKIYRRHER